MTTKFDFILRWFVIGGNFDYTCLHEKIVDKEACNPSKTQIPSATSMSVTMCLIWQIFDRWKFFPLAFFLLYPQNFLVVSVSSSSTKFL